MPRKTDLKVTGEYVWGGSIQRRQRKRLKRVGVKKGKGNRGKQVYLGGEAQVGKIIPSGGGRSQMWPVPGTNRMALQEKDDNKNE